MWLTDIAIKRPVFTTMFFLALIVLGYRSLTLMPVDLYPKVDIPIITVTTTYPGAGPEEMETLVTKPIEDQVGTINKIDEVTSVSRDSISAVVIKFLLEADLDVAAADVRDKIDLARPDLPEDADDPIISKLDFGAMPVITMGITSDSMNIRSVKTLVEQNIEDRFSKLSGVGSVDVSGGDTREIQIYADQDRLKAYGMTIEELRQIINMANLNIPGGDLKHGNKENSIKVLGEFDNVDEIKNLRITKKKKDVNYSIKLSDIADVRDASAERDAITRLDLVDSVGVTIKKQADANTLKVVELVKKELEAVQKDYPQLKIKISDDQSKFIKQSLESLREELVVGGLLAILIVFLFLHDVRSTIIIACALPTSMMSIFIILNAAGQTLNMMSLMGLALSTGILIDDSIVVLENIHRHLKMGKAPAQAALDGRSEIGLAAIAITLVDVVVYLPIAFMRGIVGRFFFSFGLTVASATLFSLLVSFTLTPMLASMWFRQEKKRKIQDLWFELKEEMLGRLKDILSPDRLDSLASLVNVKFLDESLLQERLKELNFNDKEILLLTDYLKQVKEVECEEKEQNGFFSSWWNNFVSYFDAFYDGLDNIYRGVLSRALKVRWLVVIVGMGSLVVAMKFIAPSLGFEFMSSTDKGIVTVKMELPSDSNVDETDRFIREVENRINNKKDFPEVISIFTTVGAETGSIIGGEQGPQYATVTIDFGEKYTRKRDTKEIGKILGEKLMDIPYRIIISYPSSVGGAGTEAPVQVEITGSKFQMDNIIELSEKVRHIVETTEGTQSVDTSWKEGKPETRIVMDRMKMSSHGISVGTIGSILRTSIEGNTDIKYREFGEEYDIRVRLKEKDRKEPYQVADIYLGQVDDKPISVKDIGTLKTLPAPNKIEHSNKQRKIVISAELAKGYPLGNVKRAIEERLAKEITVPSGITVKFGGEGERMVESFQYMVEALILAILLVYMVMAALFESYLNPFIIMFALPQAMVGGLLALFLTGKTLNIMSMIGIIMLVGLVGKNAILLIDYTNTLRGRGMKRDDAIKEAGPTRLRPILMTTIAMIFGMLPIALGLGSGSEMRGPMSIAVIGGLLLSTLLTLLVIPVLYAQFDDLMNFLGKVKKSISRT
ncbi:MAG: efflux RND transporter permease subunit [Candidatus Eremiobacterota bacterium]